MALAETPLVPSADPVYIKPESRRGVLPQVMVRAGSSFSAPTLMVGATLGVTLGFSGALLAALAGYGFVTLYMCFVAAQAADTGLPTASMAASALGRSGAKYLIATLVVIITIGWFGVQTGVCAASLSVMLQTVFGVTLPVWASCLILGGLMMGTAVVGFDGLKVLGTVAAPLLIAVCLYGVFASVQAAGSASMITSFAPSNNYAAAFIEGAGMAVGMFAFGGAVAADFSRYCRNRREAVIGGILGVIPTSVFAIGTGAALALVTGESDLAILMSSFGLPVLGIITLVLATWSVNAGNVFSAGINFSILLGRSDTKGVRLVTALSGVVGTGLAVAGIVDVFPTFLSMLSAVGPSLAGVLIADYWIVRRGRVQELGAVDGFSRPGMAAFVIGLVVGMVTGGTFAATPLAFLDVPFFIGPVNTVAAAMLAYVIAYRLIRRS